MALEILATRTPPQLRECLAVYKHSKGVEDGALRAGQDSPASPALPAGSPVGVRPPLVPLGSLLLPHPAPPGSVSPGRQPGVIIKEREAIINRRSLGLQGGS